MSSDLTHRYGLNCFKLHRLPTPRPNQVLGLVGTNGKEYIIDKKSIYILFIYQ